VFIPEESGKKMVITADAGVGPTYQREKERGERTGSGFCLTGPRAVFPAWSRVCPGAFSSFLISFFLFLF
jgi:hypothetical protein